MEVSIGISCHNIGDECSAIRSAAGNATDAMNIDTNLATPVYFVILFENAFFIFHVHMFKYFVVLQQQIRHIYIFTPHKSFHSNSNQI